jgi:hypothetical protein
MEPAAPVRVILLLDRRSEPIAGIVCVEDSEARPFQGWIELAQAIGAAHAGASAAPPE